MNILQPSDLGLILSYQCQNGCKHCLYNCNAQWKDWIPDNLIPAAFEAMLQIDPPPQVHITGGEPFLNYSLLIKAVKAADRAGLLCYLETNGGWATRDGLATERFELLHDYGLAAVLISVSPFHAERIPLKNTLRCIREAIDVFGPRATLIYQEEWLERIAGIETNVPISLARFEEKYGQQEAGRMLWDEFGIIPGGRAGYRLGKYTKHQPVETFRGATCRGELLLAPHSHFDLYGNFIPGFCGGISLGDWRSLDKIQRAYGQEEYPPLIAILIKDGPFGLYRLAVDQYGYQPLKEGYTGKCHLCVDVRRWLVQDGDYGELEPREFYSRF